MSVFRGLVGLLSAPLLWLGQLAHMFQMPAGAKLLQAAWWVSGQGERAKLALAAMRKQEGLAQARGRAADWLDRRPCPEIAGFAALLALEAGDDDDARQFLQRGQALGQDRDGTLDLVEYVLAARGSDSQALRDLVRRLDQRRDLPPALCRLVGIEQAYDHLLEGRFDDAARRANHLLAVADCPPAEIALWALALREGHDDQAERHLRNAGPANPELVQFQALGSAAIGRLDEVRSLLLWLQEHEPRVADSTVNLLRGKGVAI